MYTIVSLQPSISSPSGYPSRVRGSNSSWEAAMADSCLRIVCYLPFGDLCTPANSTPNIPVIGQFPEMFTAAVIRNPVISTDAMSSDIPDWVRYQ